MPLRGLAVWFVVVGHGHVALQAGSAGLVLLRVRDHIEGLFGVEGAQVAASRAGRLVIDRPRPVGAACSDFLFRDVVFAPCEHPERRKVKRRGGPGLLVVGRVVGSSCARGRFDNCIRR